MKIELDYRKCTEEDIDKALDGYTEGTVNKIHITNIHPSVLEERYDMEIDDENGFDMDWWGHLFKDHRRINVFGCCRYGYINIEKDE